MLNKNIVHPEKIKKCLSILENFFDITFSDKIISLIKKNDMVLSM